METDETTLSCMYTWSSVKQKIWTRVPLKPRIMLRAPSVILKSWGFVLARAPWRLTGLSTEPKLNPWLRKGRSGTVIMYTHLPINLRSTKLPTRKEIHTKLYWFRQRISSKCSALSFKYVHSVFSMLFKSCPGSSHFEPDFFRVLFLRCPQIYTKLTWFEDNDSWYLPFKYN